MPQSAPLSLTRRFTRLAIPNILSNVTVPLVGLVDTAMLGHLPDIRFLGGVALGAVLFDYVYWTFGFLRMGTTGTTAQAVGRDRQDEVWQILYRSVFVAVGVAAVLLASQRSGSCRATPESKRPAATISTPGSGLRRPRLRTSCSSAGCWDGSGRARRCS